MCFLHYKLQSSILPCVETLVQGHGSPQTGLISWLLRLLRQQQYRVTQKNGENLLLTRFRQFGQLMGRTYCSRRKAEHPKFESTEGFNHSTVSPCSGGEVGTGMGGGCRNYVSLFGSRLWILLDISHIIAASMAICGRPVSHLLV